MAEKLVITATETESFIESLGISEERFETIMDTLQEVGSSDENKSLTEVAVGVSNKLDLNPNEILLLGFKLGQLAMAQRNTLAGLMEAILAGGMDEDSASEESSN
jgi:hypothetical protein